MGHFDLIVTKIGYSNIILNNMSWHNTIMVYYIQLQAILNKWCWSSLVYDLSVYTVELRDVLLLWQHWLSWELNINILLFQYFCCLGSYLSRNIYLLVNLFCGNGFHRPSLRYDEKYILSKTIICLSRICYVRNQQ